MNPKVQIDPKRDTTKPERCEICQRLAGKGDGRYECMKCRQIVCSSCSYNAGEHGYNVICDECVRTMSPQQKKKWGVIDD